MQEELWNQGGRYTRIINATSVRHRMETENSSLDSTIPTISDTSATKVDSTAAELNLLNTSSAGTITNGKAVIYQETNK